ncbi:hypothetical protein V6N13_104789 [Hibiscus sabdariffa]|uniref:Uncharacterized protein n=2 Tax=Hibiscus sabdariffa TaxID=183260 RepID=A0ABR2CJ60_9ROSI
MEPQFQEPNLHPKQKSSAFALTRHRGPQEAIFKEDQKFDEDEEEEEEEYELDEEKPRYTSSTTPNSRCSRGVSTDELEYHQHSSSIISEKQVQSNNTTSKRFEYGEPVANVSALSRNSSVLLQLIAGGEPDVKLRLGTLILELIRA